MLCCAMPILCQWSALLLLPVLLCNAEPMLCQCYPIPMLRHSLLNDVIHPWMLHSAFRAGVMLYVLDLALLLFSQAPC
eukprot:1796547-Pyramimonas_sp.AAC.1